VPAPVVEKPVIKKEPQTLYEYNFRPSLNISVEDMRREKAEQDLEPNEENPVLV